VYSVIVIASCKQDAFKRFRDKSIGVCACLVGRGCGRWRVLDDLYVIVHLLLVAVLLVRDRLDGLADVAVTPSLRC